MNYQPSAITPNMLNYIPVKKSEKFSIRVIIYEYEDLEYNFDNLKDFFNKFIPDDIDFHDIRKELSKHGALYCYSKIYQERGIVKIHIQRKYWPVEIEDKRKYVPNKPSKTKPLELTEHEIISESKND